MRCVRKRVARFSYRNSVIGVNTLAAHPEANARLEAGARSEASVHSEIDVSSETGACPETGVTPETGIADAVDTDASAAHVVAPDRRPLRSYDRSGAPVQSAPAEPLPAPLLELTITPVDAVGLSERAAALAKRSVKTSSKEAALRLAISCMDLTTLEGADTPGKVLSLCDKALRPEPDAPDVPPVAAVCVYPELVPVATAALAGTSVRVASVAGSFPAGLGPLDARLSEIRTAVAAGAHEIDIVLNRSAFLAGRYRQAFNEVAASKESAGEACLKVILETGELGSYDAVRRASMLAMAAGADFIKTSTGKIGTSATLPAALCMAEAIREFADSEGRLVGLKVAGGIRTAKEAWQYLVVVAETLGRDWLTPHLFRIGASSLLNDVLLQLDHLRLGRYVRADKTLA